jgi:mono/diheme cytochrome c family protein
MRFFILGFILVAVAIAIVAGPRGHKHTSRPIELFNDMDHQSKVKYQKASKFFADGHASRMPVDGTVPIGLRKPGSKDETHILNSYVYQSGDSYTETGKFGTVWGDGIPKEFTIDAAFMATGKERYEINCKICHGALGDGQGITPKYGLAGVPSYHDDRMRNMPDGELYNTVAHGKGLMFGYGANLNLKQRWAIVAYLRALQKTQTGTEADLTEADRAKLNGADQAAAPAPAATPAPAGAPAPHGS